MYALSKLSSQPNISRKKMLGSHDFTNECYKAFKGQVIQILFKLLRRTEEGTLNKSFCDANIIFIPVPDKAAWERILMGQSPSADAKKKRTKQNNKTKF